MAVPSRRHKAGAREIMNRLSKESQDISKHQRENKEVSPEEHEKKLKILREIGILK